MIWISPWKSTTRMGRPALASPDLKQLFWIPLMTVTHQISGPLSIIHKRLAECVYVTAPSFQPGLSVCPGLFQKMLQPSFVWKAKTIRWSITGIASFSRRAVFRTLIAPTAHSPYLKPSVPQV